MKDAICGLQDLSNERLTDVLGDRKRLVSAIQTEHLGPLFPSMVTEVICRSYVAVLDSCMGKRF